MVLESWSSYLCSRVLGFQACGTIAILCGPGAGMGAPPTESHPKALPYTFFLLQFNIGFISFLLVVNKSINLYSYK